MAMQNSGWKWMSAGGKLFFVVGLMWAGGTRAQEVPPANSFIAAVEIPCTAQDNPQQFSKRIVPAAPDSQSDIKLVVGTDNSPILAYAVVRTSPNSVDVFLQIRGTFEPFPYVPLFRCYQFPVGVLAAGTAAINFETAFRVGTLSNYVRNTGAFTATSFLVAAFVPQGVPAQTELSLTVLALIVVGLGFRALHAARVAIK
jgi:hypothetical protein